MRTLNCKCVAGMISLYVAGDLVGAPEREVAAHLAACEACRRLAEEFAESNSLLTQACTPPEFGPEFYSGIRSAVLDKIARDRRLLKSPLYRRWWAYATALAAVVIVFGLALQYFSRNPREARRGVALLPPVAGQPNSGQAGATKAPLPKVLTLANRPRGPRQFEAMRKPDASAQARRDGRTQIAQAMPLGESPPSASARASVSQVSRIEIQTADPNIRIIWLGPRESEPTNHDQHQDENGNRK